jgi:hypothetical protein
MGILDALSGVANPLSAKSRAGRKLQNEALKWAFNRCKLNTPYYVRNEIADRYKSTYTGTNPDGYVYFEFVFVRKTLINKIPVTAHGATAVHIYYTYNGEITDKRPKSYLTKDKLKQIEARIIRESGGGFTFD